MLIAGTVCRSLLGDVVGRPEVLTDHLVGSSGCRLKILSARKFLPHLEPLGSPLSLIRGTGGGQNRGLNPMMQGTLRLLREGGVEDALLPLVHLAHRIEGGC
jgi:hypothetical protein